MICTSIAPLGIERAADGADPPVHHVGRRDDVAARLRLDQRLLDQDLNGLVVEDFAAPQQAVMAVAGIGIERDIAEDADVGHFLLDGADGAADEIVRVERLGAGLVAQAGVGIGEQGDAGNVAAGPPVRRLEPPRRSKSAPPPASIPPGYGCVRRRPGTTARSGRRWSARFPAPSAEPTRISGCGGGER